MAWEYSLTASEEINQDIICAFPPVCPGMTIVKNMENLQDYIVERKKDPKDSMYNKFDAIVKEITEKF